MFNQIKDFFTNLFVDFISGQSMNALPFYIVLFILGSGAYFGFKSFILTLKKNFGNYSFIQKLQTNSCSIIFSLLFVLVVVLFQNYKLGHRESDVCKEIGSRKSAIIQYIEDINNFDNHPSEQKKLDVIMKKASDGVEDTSNWIKKNIGDSAYADFKIVEELPVLPSDEYYSPEGRLELNLNNYEKNLKEIENKYCR